MPFFRGTRYPLLGGSGISYILRDEFSDTLAAGAVNGTPATPGPGTRTVTDTGGILSLAGGQLIVAGVGAGDDPRLTYGTPAITREAGRILILAMANTVTREYWGFSTANPATNATGQPLFNRSAAVMSFRIAAAASVGIAATASFSKYAIRLRATGAQLFGYDTAWRLLYSVETGATATLYVCPACGYGAGAQVAASDYVRVPVPLWQIAPLASDSFDRSNGSLHASVTDGLAVEEVGGAGKVWTATTWTIATNVAKNTPGLGSDVIVNGAFAADTNWTKGANWAIGSGVATATAATEDLTQTVAPLTANLWYQITWTNGAGFSGYIGPVCGTVVGGSVTGAGSKLVIIPANGTGFAMRPDSGAVTGTIDDVVCQPITMANLFATVPIGVADVLVELPITSSTTSTTPIGIVVNLDSASNPQNFIIAYYGMVGARVYVDEYVAGVRTNKITAVVTYAAGAKIKLVRDGTSLWCFYNEAAVGTVQTMTANTGTNHGALGTASTPTINNIAIFSRGTDGSYEALSSF